MDVELVRESTGEVVSLEEHLEAARAIEREVGRLDVAIAAMKEELKDAKVGREKAVKDLRAHVREIKVLSSRGRRRGKK